MEMETAYDPARVESRWLGRREPGSVLPAGSRTEGLEAVLGEVVEDIFDRRARMCGGAREVPGPVARPAIAIDPEPDVSRYGVDAFRFGLALLVRNGTGGRPGVSRLEQGRHFLNKLWHASRYALDRLQEAAPGEDAKPPFEDRWILSRLHRTVRHVGENLDAGRLSEAAEIADGFVRHELSEWYLPLAKGRPVADAALLGTLAETLRVLSPLLFPLVPIVTEEIRNHLSRVLGEPPVSLEDEPWPEPDDTKIDDAADGEMRVVIRIVRKVRNIRGLSRVPTGAEPVATVSAADESAAALLIRHSERIRRLAGVSAVVAGVDLTPPRGAAAGGVGEFQVFLSFGEEVDPRAEIDRLRGESYELVEQVRSSERRLQNRDFLERAPAEVVDRERIRRDGLADRLARIQQHIESLEDARK